MSSEVQPLRILPCGRFTGCREGRWWQTIWLDSLGVVTWVSPAQRQSPWDGPLSWPVACACGRKLEAAWPAVTCAPGVLLPKSPWEVALWTGTDWGHINLWVYVRWHGGEGSVVKASEGRKCMPQSHHHKRSFQPFIWPPPKSKGRATHTPGRSHRSGEGCQEQNRWSLLWKHLLCWEHLICLSGIYIFRNQHPLPGTRFALELI